MSKRILIINVNWIGDVLFSTPFIKAVRMAHPESHIACLVHPRCAAMLESNPRLNEIIIYDEEGAHKSLWGKRRLIEKLRDKHFDTAFILHRSFTKALLAYLAGAKERIGYPTKHRAWLLTKAAQAPDGEAHKVEYFLELARASGIETPVRSYEFFVKNADRRFVGEFLKNNGVREDDILVAICPGGNWDPKRWPKENFASLSDALIDRFGAKIVITGTKKETGLAEDIKNRMKGPAIIACGLTTLGELGALLERSSLAVANDTGSMHIAVAMKTRTIALFGPTSPRITGPYGEGNYRVISKNTSCDVPCYDLACKDNRCMNAISVEDVLEAAEEMLCKKP